jgi:hypothetical protein
MPPQVIEETVDDEQVPRCRHLVKDELAHGEVEHPEAER